MKTIFHKYIAVLLKHLQPVNVVSKKNPFKCSRVISANIGNIKGAPYWQSNLRKVPLVRQKMLLKDIMLLKKTWAEVSKYAIQFNIFCILHFSLYFYKKFRYSAENLPKTEHWPKPIFV